MNAAGNALPENGLFVVRQEGGMYEWLSKSAWDQEIKRAPIFGVKIGELFIGRDKFVRRYGLPDLWMRHGWTWNNGR